MDDAWALQGCTVTRLWWERDEDWSIRRTHRELRAWLQGVQEAARHTHMDAVLLHYSVFTWGRRGLPVHVPLLARGLANLNAPLALLLHEFAYPLRRRGWRGASWAVTQRLALLPMMAVAGGAIVTSEDRVRWLSSRPWLPSRALVAVPVFSNLPGPPARREPGRETRSMDLRVGVLGYGNETFAADPVAGAIALLASRGVDTRLLMIGAPGVESARGREWSVAAERAGCAQALRFTGTLTLPDLSSAVAEQDVIVLPDTLGPTPGKTSLAAALSHGVPVVALDGPSRWEALVQQRAVVLASDAEGVAAALLTLWEDRDARKLQGDQGRAFYLERMAADVVAMQVVTFLQSLNSSVGSRA